MRDEMPFEEKNWFYFPLLHGLAVMVAAIVALILLVLGGKYEMTVRIFLFIAFSVMFFVGFVFIIKALKIRKKIMKKGSGAKSDG